MPVLALIFAQALEVADWRQDTPAGATDNRDSTITASRYFAPCRRKNQFFQVVSQTIPAPLLAAGHGLKALRFKDQFKVCGR